MNLPTPSVEYGLLSPMLIVFGAAIAGVLVEAFLPRGSGATPPSWCSRSAAWRPRWSRCVAVARDLHGDVGRTAVMGAVAVDAPALFLQGTILLVGILGILLIAERRIPRTESESESGARRAGCVHPAGLRGGRQRRREAGHQGRCDADRGLPADHVRHRRHAAVPGRRRPADDVHRARGAVAAAVPDVRAGPPPPAAFAGSRAEILSARRVFVGVLPVRRRACCTATRAR